MAVRTEIRIRLTPLGRWGLREALLAEGAEVPEGQTSVYGVLEA